MRRSHECPPGSVVSGAVGRAQSRRHLADAGRMGSPAHPGPKPPPPEPMGFHTPPGEFLPTPPDPLGSFLGPPPSSRDKDFTAGLLGLLPSWASGGGTTPWFASCRISRASDAPHTPNPDFSDRGPPERHPGRGRPATSRLYRPALEQPLLSGVGRVSLLGGGFLPILWGK